MREVVSFLLGSAANLEAVHYASCNQNEFPLSLSIGNTPIKGSGPVLFQSSDLFSVFLSVAAALPPKEHDTTALALRRTEDMVSVVLLPLLA